MPSPNHKGWRTGAGSRGDDTESDGASVAGPQPYEGDKREFPRCAVGSSRVRVGTEERRPPTSGSRIPPSSDGGGGQRITHSHSLTSSHDRSRGVPGHRLDVPRRRGSPLTDGRVVGRASTAPDRDSGLHLPPRGVHILTSYSASQPMARTIVVVSESVGFISRLKSLAFSSNHCKTLTVYDVLNGPLQQAENAILCNAGRRTT